MKHTKKLVSLLLALVMVFALSISAFAANITIEGGAAGSEYAAYKLLNATDGGDGKFAYTLNATYEAILKEVTQKTTGAEIVDYISKLDTDGIRTFADTIYGKVKSMTADATSTNGTFANVAQGYYLIVETQLGTWPDGGTDTYSLVMLDTAGKTDITVATKEDKPTVTKKVTEKNDSTGTTADQDAADYDIGDDVPFTLTGIVSSKYADYEKYYFAFHDTLSAGLEFNTDSIVVKVDNDTITTGYQVVTAGLTDSCTFEVVFENLKAIASVKAGSTITVEYTAELLDTATVGGNGNSNTVKLEYSNNPYDSGDGKPGTGKTPEDKVTVFTYKLVVDKVDQEGKALEGAGFTLYKYNDTAKNYVSVGNEVKDVTTFTFTGLDAGQYKLVETTVPAGYNKADDVEFTIEATYDTESADPKLTSLVVKDKDGSVISATAENQEASFATVLLEGKVSTKVVNKAGAELPSTGGIGTTIFYILGGLLAVGAVVLLVTKRRMNAER